MAASSGVLVCEDLAVAHLEYADDLVPITDNIVELQRYVDAIVESSACLGLKLNSVKW